MRTGGHLGPGQPEPRAGHGRGPDSGEAPLAGPRSPLPFPEGEDLRFRKRRLGLEEKTPGNPGPEEGPGAPGRRREPARQGRGETAGSLVRGRSRNDPRAASPREPRDPPTHPKEAGGRSGPGARHSRVGGPPGPEPWAMAAAGAIPQGGDVEGGAGWKKPERPRRNDRSVGHVIRGT